MIPVEKQPSDQSDDEKIKRLKKSYRPKARPVQEGLAHDIPRPERYSDEDDRKNGEG